MSETGLISIPSAHGFAATLDRLQRSLQAKGLTVFGLFDHAAGAAGAGMALRPTTVLVFGNPAAGTKLMQANQRAGIDLPLKILLCEDGAGRVTLTYDDPSWIARRHGLGPATDPVIAAMTTLLATLAREAGDQ